MKKKIIIIFYSLLLILLTIFIYLIKSENISDYLFIFPDFIASLIKVYLVNLTHYGKEMTSLGIFYRLVPTIFSIMFSIILFRKNLLNFNINLYYFYIFLFISVIILALSGFTTIADRIHLYLILFNILILSNLNKIFLLRQHKIFSDFFVILLVFIPLLFWLYFSKFSIKNWQPYHLGI